MGTPQILEAIIMWFLCGLGSRDRGYKTQTSRVCWIRVVSEPYLPNFRVVDPTIDTLETQYNRKRNAWEPRPSQQPQLYGFDRDPCSSVASP